MFYLQQVYQCDRQAEKIREEYKEREGKDYQDNNKVKPMRHNEPVIKDLYELVLGILGANPTVFPGLTDYNFMQLTAELGDNIKQ